MSRCDSLHKQPASTVNDRTAAIEVRIVHGARGYRQAERLEGRGNEVKVLWVLSGEDFPMGSDAEAGAQKAVRANPPQDPIISGSLHADQTGTGSEAAAAAAAVPGHTP
jgi:hypothetical protein